MSLFKKKPVRPETPLPEMPALLTTVAGKPRRKKKATAETTTQREIVDFLRKRGFLVKITASHQKQAFGMKGMPDLIVHGQNFTLYVECKSPTGELRPAQIQFQNDIARYAGPNLLYTVARKLEDVTQFMATHQLL